MRDWLRWMVCCVTLLGLQACSDDDADTSDKTTDAGKNDAGGQDAGKPDAGEAPYESEVYAKDDNWLCRPGASNNRCKGPAEATEIGLDDSLSTVPAPAKVTNKTDCFYVYPTIDVAQDQVGQVTDYSNIESIWVGAKLQAEYFGNMCDVYAPLYHQVKIGTYLSTKRDELLEEAYKEVEDAFLHYMGQYNKGRQIILIGHSQGTHMLRRLLQRHFDGADNAKLRKQLALAVLLGTLGDITVPKGERVGGTFMDIPVCKDASERGCIITYSSYSADKPPNATYGLALGGIPEGRDTPCTNPADMSGAKAMTSGAYFLSNPSGVAIGTTTDVKSELGVKTDIAVYRKLYNLECKKNNAGYTYLEVTVQQPDGAKRKDPINYKAEALAIDQVGLHVLDFNFVVEDLAGIIKKHVE